MNSRGRYVRLWIGCLGIAAIVVTAVVYLSSHATRDRGKSGPEEQGGQPVAAISLPSEPVAATVEQLRHEAEQVVETLRARFPRSPEALHTAARLYADLEQTHRAQEIWEECVRLAPQYPGPHAGLAIVAVEQGRDRDAVAILQHALAIGCSSAELYAQLAKALTKLGKLREACEVARRGVAAFPQSPEGWFLLGQAQNQLGRFQEAERSLRRAIALGPESAAAHFALAAACDRQGKHDEAAAQRRRFAELKAKHPLAAGRRFQVVYASVLRRIVVETLDRAGMVYAQHDDAAEAERLFLRALALVPSNVEGCQLLAGLYRRQGRIADAYTVARRLTEIEPANAVHYVNLASIAAALGDASSAEASLKQAMTLRSDWSVAPASLAQLYLQTGRAAEARPLAEHALRLQESVQGYRLLASICGVLGDSTAAEKAAEKARTLSLKAASSGRGFPP